MLKDQRKGLCRACFSLPLQDGSRTMKTWSVYLLRNERGALYTGISNDPERRLAEHRRGLSKGAKYTRACQSLEQVYCCEVGSRGTALRIENRIKQLRKARKEALVAAGPSLERLVALLDLTGAVATEEPGELPGSSG